jgi:hypothetical protein
MYNNKNDFKEVPINSLKRRFAVWSAEAARVKISALQAPNNKIALYREVFACRSARD